LDINYYGKKARRAVLHKSAASVERFVNRDLQSLGVPHKVDVVSFGRGRIPVARCTWHTMNRSDDDITVCPSFQTRLSGPSLNYLQRRAVKPFLPNIWRTWEEHGEIDRRLRKLDM